jgi:peroxiredoxin
MRRTIVFFLYGFVFLVAGKALGQSKENFTIDAELPGLKEGSMVTMDLALDDNKFQAIDSAYIKNGRFEITGQVLGGPRMYFLNLSKNPSKYIRLLIDNGEHLQIRSNHDIFKIDHACLDDQLIVEGSPSNATLHYLIPVNTLYTQSINRLNRMLRLMKDSIGFDGDLVSGFMESKNQINLALYYNFLHLHEDEDFKPADPFIDIPFFVTASSNMASRSGHAAFLMWTYNNLNAKEKESYYGRELYEQAKLCIGQPFPSFALPGPDGKVLSSSDVVARSKLTLIHFWAKDSYERGPLEAELRVFYQKYHAKGLNIIGFSSDKYADEWKDILQQEQFPWYNVSDLKGRDGMVEKVYHEFGDPITHNTTNVLVDNQGKILAWDVSGVELQWYLWKAFGE